MASSHPIIPCMHCNSQDPRGVSSLGHRLIATGLFFYPLTFADPTPTKIEFTAAVTLLDSYQTQIRSNPKFNVLRDAQTLVVFDMETSLLYYVKPICGHNIDLITKSGFDPNVQPQKAPIPDQPVILRIVKGKEFGTYKVFLQRIINKVDVPKAPVSHQKNNTYVVEISLTPDVEASWKNILSGVKSTKLIFDKYTPFVKNYVRVYSQNASGKGQASMIYSFIPE